MSENIKVSKENNAKKVWDGIKHIFVDYNYVFTFLVIFIAFLWINGDATTWKSVTNIFLHSAILGSIALGMGLVILTSDIDLSVGSSFVLVGGLAILMYNFTGSIFIMLLSAIVMGTACGFINGFLVGKVHMPAFIVTLATMLIFRSISQYLMNDQRVTQTILGHFSQVSTCPDCNGTGKKITNPCKDCNGKGRKEVSKTINIKIPAGIDNGTKLRVSNEGDAGKFGGPSGDLYVVIFVKEHEFFKRDGVSIYFEQQISFAQAALGDEVVVPTVDGEQKIKIAAGTQSETVLSIKNVGVPYLNNPARRGDQFVKVVVKTPKHLNDEELKLYKRLREIEQQNDSKESLIDKVKDVFTGVGK